MRKDRAQLHRFLQISVATWARPDAAHDVSTAASATSGIRTRAR
jgi:hypothetical protein